MKRPRICGVITEHNQAAISDAAPKVDLFELRLDLVGFRWTEIPRLLTKPWIATNRLAVEGGNWSGTESERTAELLRALDLGASVVDIELAAAGLNDMLPYIKTRAECLVSSHNFKATPPLGILEGIVRDELEAGADICKVATTALRFEDNIIILELIRRFPDKKIVALAMGEPGQPSRLLGPLAGGEFTYGALQPGKGSAPGQLTVAQLARSFEALGL